MALAAMLLLFSSSTISFAADKIVENANGDLSSGSFRQVVRDAQGGDGVLFAPGIENILLDGYAENGSTALSIDGGTTGVILDGQGKNSAVRLTNEPATYGLKNLTFVNATHNTPSGHNYDGGAVFSAGKTSLSKTVFENNFLRPDTTNQTFAVRGGAFHSGDFAYITDSTFTNNIAVAVQQDIRQASGQNEGGAMAFGGAVAVKQSVSGNDKSVISRSTFKGNQAVAIGGTVYLDTQPSENLSTSASADGGALSGMNISIDSSVFTDNLAYAMGGTLSDPANVVASTGASAYGGAASLAISDSAAISNSRFENNKAVAHYGNGINSGQHIAFGGALDVDVFPNTQLEIVDSTFKNNAAEATTDNAFVDTSVNGGAISYRTKFTGDFDITLKATTGNETVFRGNTVRYGDADPKANSFYIINTQTGIAPVDTFNLNLNIATEDNAVVALDDPITVGASYKTTIAVAGEGLFRWGGNNAFEGDVTDGSIPKIDFQSGNILLRSDFTANMVDVDDPADNAMIVNMSANAQVYTDLTDRDKDLAMFQKVDSFNVNQTKITAISYSLEATDPNAKYLVTDNRDGVDANNFVIDNSPSAWFRTTISTQGDNLYIGVDNSGAIAPIVNHANDNVQNAYWNGGMNQAYLNVLKQADPSDWNAIFSAVRNNAQKLLPEAIASQAVVGRDWSRNFTQSLWQIRGDLNGSTQCGPAACGPCNPCGSSKACKRNVWGGYVGNHAEQYVDDGYFGYKADINGVMVGLDTALNRRFEIGTYFVYGDGRTKSDALSSRIESDAYQFGFYGSWKANKKWALRADVSYGHYENDSERWNVLGTQNASFDQNIFNMGLLAKRDIRLSKRSLLSPYAGLRYIYLDQDSVRETAVSGMSTSVSGMNGESLESVFGASWAIDMRRSTTTFYADWRHEFCDAGFGTLASFNGAPQVFYLNSVARQRDSADLGFDWKTSWNGRMGRNWTAHVGYTANLARHYQSQAYYATFGLKF